MKAIAKRIEDMFIEITFAGSGESDATRGLMGVDSGGGNSAAGYCVSGFCTGRA